MVHRHLPIWQMLLSFTFGTAKRKTAIGCIIHLIFNIILSLFWFSPVNFSLLQSLLVIVSGPTVTFIDITNKGFLMHRGYSFSFVFYVENWLKNVTNWWYYKFVALCSTSYITCINSTVNLPTSMTFCPLWLDIVDSEFILVLDSLYSYVVYLIMVLL